MIFNFKRNKKKLLILGDSHCEVFRSPIFKEGIFKDYDLTLELVYGATISGIENPNSKTQALPIFEKAYKAQNPEIVVIMLGEVDTGFVLWLQAEQKSLSISDMLDKCVEKYSRFLASHLGTKKTIVISAPLPTIKDGQDWGDIANARREVKATQKERTALTIQLNEKINGICSEMGIEHINLDKICLGDDNVVSQILLNEDPNNHHYDNNIFAPLLSKKLKKHI